MNKGNPNSFGTYLESINRSSADVRQDSAPSENDPILRIATTLEAMGPLTFTALCSATQMSPSTAVELLQRMEKFSLLTTVESGKIELMEAGHELAKSAMHGLDRPESAEEGAS